MIWRGTVYQSFISREDVVDFVVTLRCIISLIDPIPKHVSMSFAKGTSQFQQVLRAADAAGITIGHLEEGEFTSQQSARGGVIFGDAASVFDAIAAAQGMRWFIDMTGKLQFGKLTNIGAPADFTFSSPSGPSFAGTLSPGATYSILGTPQQTQMGVNFRVLLDPRIEIQLPLTRVKIDNSVLIQAASFPFPGQGLPPRPSLNGTYFVVAVRHVGDSRGDQWETQLICASDAWAQQLGLAAS